MAVLVLDWQRRAHSDRVLTTFNPTYVQRKTRTDETLDESKLHGQLYLERRALTPRGS